MSTFGALNTAYRGLTAAQQGMNVAGQNIANAATEGYTRQRVEQSSLAAPARGLFSGGTLQPGQGVSVDAIARLGNSFLDGSVRSAGAQAGYASVRSSALQGIEGVLQEPGENGISTALQGFWSAWQAAANEPSEDGPKGLLLNAANSVSGQDLFRVPGPRLSMEPDPRPGPDNVDAVNAAAAQVAAFNTTIRSTLAADGSANELIDARARLTERSPGSPAGPSASRPTARSTSTSAAMPWSWAAPSGPGALRHPSSDRMGSSVQLVWKNPAGSRPAGTAANSPAHCPCWRPPPAAPAASSPRRRSPTTNSPRNLRGRGEPIQPRASQTSPAPLASTSSPPPAPALPRSASTAPARHHRHCHQGVDGRRPGHQHCGQDLPARHRRGFPGQDLVRHRHRYRRPVTRRPAA